MGKTIKRNGQYKIKKSGQSLEKDNNWKKKPLRDKRRDDIYPIDIPPKEY